LENFIEVKASPTADFNFSDNPATIYETTIYMQDKSSVDVVDWQWTSIYSDPTNSTSSEPVFVFPEESGTYPVTLTVTTDQGCIDSITYLMNIVEDILFFAPNTFTPDGDEFNQYWKPEISGIDVYGFELTIFNRWGQVIWENHDPSVGWDGTFNGKIIQAGAYAWVAKVKSPYNDDKKVFTGSVSIIK
jgi:gliding motility-associated-like protein